MSKTALLFVTMLSVAENIIQIYMSNDNDDEFPVQNDIFL